MLLLKKGKLEHVLCSQVVTSASVPPLTVQTLHQQSLCPLKPSHYRLVVMANTLTGVSSALAKTRSILESTYTQINHLSVKCFRLKQMNDSRMQYITSNLFCLRWFKLQRDVRVPSILACWLGVNNTLVTEKSHWKRLNNVKNTFITYSPMGLHMSTMHGSHLHLRISHSQRTPQTQSERKKPS